MWWKWGMGWSCWYILKSWKIWTIISCLLENVFGSHRRSHAVRSLPRLDKSVAESTDMRKKEHEEWRAGGGFFFSRSAMSEVVSALDPFYSPPNEDHCEQVSLTSQSVSDLYLRDWLVRSFRRLRKNKLQPRSGGGNQLKRVCQRNGSHLNNMALRWWSDHSWRIDQDCILGCWLHWPNNKPTNRRCFSWPKIDCSSSIIRHLGKKGGAVSGRNSSVRSVWWWSSLYSTTGGRVFCSTSGLPGAYLMLHFHCVKSFCFFENCPAFVLCMRFSVASHEEPGFRRLSSAVSRWVRPDEGL